MSCSESDKSIKQLHHLSPIAASSPEFPPNHCSLTSRKFATPQLLHSKAKHWWTSGWKQWTNGRMVHHDTTIVITTTQDFNGEKSNFSLSERPWVSDRLLFFIFFYFSPADMFFEGGTRWNHNAQEKWPPKSRRVEVILATYWCALSRSFLYLCTSTW